ncbi:lipoprotein signal peptidase [Paenibacillus vortex V453]|uniref:Lipoprotein signal peptidase n=1 Tax=Paenibacillus vortex V453 TaxID=715225 RepID=A0A2R9SXV9_9BACL|nr:MULTISPECIES: signal peptidase II [Paenibacillus]RKM08323.1 lipoprotein signal peptidase [Moraxella catarrhalis]ANA81701.1 signal peptidase II [Paenibacillus glucanolyticus]AVV59567.1 lipoprotein signal peptidase [Paenibacillus glucanolyticus]AWP28824.1 signal peptidase II [Paenibacillus sp. Cedars]EFU42126.1 lipoprotein signal peptidase [Paenibacillus vortex V453]
MVYYLIAFVLFLIDQGTKYLIATNLELYEQIPVIGDFFLITSSRNRGAAFGILQDQLWFFIVVTLIVVAGIIWYLQKVVKEGRRLLPTALALVLGGALGNFIDRLVMGEVVDFLQFNFGSYTFPIFNIADSCIVIGVALIILDTLLDGRREKMKTTSGVSGTEGNE